MEKLNPGKVGAIEQTRQLLSGVRPDERLLWGHVAVRASNSACVCRDDVCHAAHSDYECAAFPQFRSATNQHLQSGVRATNRLDDERRNRQIEGSTPVFAPVQSTVHKTSTSLLEPGVRLWKSFTNTRQLHDCDANASALQEQRVSETPSANFDSSCLWRK
jgi:hypothetical protein